METPWVTKDRIFAKPHRGVFFIPPQSEKARGKIPKFALTNDAILLNLEDAIAVSEKEAARAGAVKALNESDFGDSIVMCRINGIGTAWHEQDLHDIIYASSTGRHVDVVMIPKVQSVKDIKKVLDVIKEHEHQFGIEVPTLIAAILETAEGVQNVDSIARADHRMHSIHIGPADLAASLGIKVLDVGGYHQDCSIFHGEPPSENGEEDNRQQTLIDIWNPYVTKLVVACRAAEIIPFYGPFGRAKDYAASYRQFRSMAVRGCVGGWVLNPIQIEAANDAFSPTVDEIKDASQIISFMEEGEKRGDGAVMRNGIMLDEAVWKQAANIINQAGQISKKDSKRSAQYSKVPGFQEAVKFVQARD